MKRMLVLMSVLVGAAIVGRRVLPVDWRERLSRLPAALMGRMMAHMPDE